MTEQKKAPAKRARKATPPRPGYVQDENGSWYHPTLKDEFQSVVAAGGKWLGVPDESAR